MSFIERSSLLSEINSEQQSHQEISHSPSSSEWSENENDRSGQSSSYSSSMYSNSDGSFANDWEIFVTEEKRLFYIEINSITVSKNDKTDNSLTAAKNQFSRAPTRRSNKQSKISRYVGKSRKKTNQLINNEGISTNTETKVKFSESSEGETKQLYLYLDPSNRYRYGRRSSICESLLGLSLSPFSDGKRLMVANFMPNFNSNKNMIKIGDWLKNINNFDINSTNLDEVLLSFIEPCEILLKLQKMSDEEEIQFTEIEYGRITSLGMMCDLLEKFFTDESANENYIEDYQDTFSLMYLTMEGLEEQGPEGQDVLYCYPQKHENFLYSSRGSFLTLNSILKSGINSSPEVATIDFGNNKYNVSFTAFNEDLLLLAVRNDILTKNELKFKTHEIINYFELMHRNLSENFYPQNLVNMNCYCKLLKIEILKKQMPIFEHGLLFPHYVPLPKEAQLRIDDALSEMEAMDYREWNSEPLKSQREFFIVGSLLYFKSYLLASHLPPPDLLDIESFLRMNGLFELLNNNKNITIKELIIWNEIYPNNCFSDIRKNNIPSQGRWFLAVIGISQMILVSILEYRCSELDGSYNHNKRVEPSPFYIEEIQDTLDHLKLGGIEKLASTWMHHNRRPQTNLDDSKVYHSFDNSTQYLKPKAELVSILKRKNNSTENVGSSSIHSQTISEDSDRKCSQNEDEEECDSDWDGFPSDSQKSSSGFDISEMTETLLKEVSDILPTKITAGIDNVLFHYVQIEMGEAYILTPTNVIENYIIEIFRQSCHLIHTVLQNTLKFRKILSEDGQKPHTASLNQHRSLVAIKEHGILFNIKNEKDEIHEFWVVGRLFNSPVRELYICHRADIPQNLVEIAFRLNLHLAG